MPIELTEPERQFLEQLIAEGMDRLGHEIDALADQPDSEAMHKLGNHLGFLNGIAAKLCKPPALTEEEQKLAAIDAPDGVLSGDARHLIDWLWLGRDRE